MPLKCCINCKQGFTCKCFNTKYLGTSHCIDMYANEPGDPEELVAARARIGELVNKCLKEVNTTNSS